MEDFSKRLKEALNKKKMKPTELASRLKLNKGIISNYLSGKYKPRQDRLDLIAAILGVDVVWLMGYDVEDKELINLINKYYSLLTEEDKNDIKRIIYDRVIGSGTIM